MYLEVSVVKREKDFVVLACLGEIDMHNRSLFQECMKSIITGSNKLIIDVSKITYMDCSGLNIFISSLKKLKENNGNLVLCGQNPFVKKMLSTTGLDKVFICEKNIDEAIAFITKHP